MKYLRNEKPSQRIDQTLKKSFIFSQLKRNSNFFSPTLRCFYFATTQRSTIDRHLDRTKQNTNCLYLETEE